MSRTFLILLRLVLAAMVLVAAMTAQCMAQRYTVAPGSSLRVEGTSTLHDWHLASSNLTVQAQFNGETLAGFTVRIPVSSLKSGKDGLDRNAYKELKAEAHPTIQVVSAAPATLANGQLNVTADISVAGNTRRVTVPVTMIRAGDGATAKGAIQVKMTDFGVEPPVLMMGTLKTGDPITIRFDIKLRKGSTGAM